MVEQLATWDIVVVVLYFAIIIAIGIYASCKSSRGTVNGYYLAGRNMNFLMVGFSLYVSNIGTEHFMGFAGTAAAGGLGVGAWEFTGLVVSQILGFVFLPVYLASQIRTTPEYLAKRFGGQRLRIFFSTVSLLIYVLTKCSVGLFAGGVFIQQALGWDLNLSMAVLIIIVAFLTIAGGMTAVIYTDSFQCVLMVTGASVITALGMREVGGLEGLWERYPQAVANTTGTNCSSSINPNWDRMLRGLGDPDFPWLGFVLGAIPNALWYVCVDQVMAQRGLSSKSLSHGQAGTLLFAIIKTPSFFIMGFPGMISRILYTEEVACVDPDKCFEICGTRSGCSNIAFVKLVLNILPIGLRGLMLSVTIAALMSGLDSFFNSSSAIFVIDIWSRIRKKPSVKEQMVVGRLFMVLMAGLAMAWVPMLKELNGGQIFMYFSEVQNYLAPQLAAVFLLAVLWPRFNEKGAFWSLIIAFAVGMARLIVVMVYQPPEACSGVPDTRPSFVKDIPFLYIGAFLLFFTLFMGAAISLFTEKPTYKNANRIHAVWKWWGLRFSHVTRNEVNDQKVASITEESSANAAPVYRAQELSALGTGDGCPKEVSSKSSNKYAVNDSDGDSTAAEESRGWDNFCLNWICGLKGSGESSNDADTQMEARREEEACSLEQKPRVKLVLNVLAVAFFILGVALYLFWSLWTYTPTY